MRFVQIVAASALIASAHPLKAQSEEEVAFAKAFLDRLQIRSIVENREHCGFFGRDTEGNLRATKAVPGKYDSCVMGTPPADWEIVASYHTHASFNPATIDEIPSFLDLDTDIASGTDGYVSTPGGRLWFSDHEAQVVRQICGAGCLTQDPSFRPGKAMKVRQTYSIEDLRRMTGR